MRALRTAASGMAAQQLNVEVISNNIANMNTVGFKKQRAEFQDLLYQNVERMGAQSSAAGTVVPTGIQIGAGVKAGPTAHFVACSLGGGAIAEHLDDYRKILLAHIGHLARSCDATDGIVDHNGSACFFYGMDHRSTPVFLVDTIVDIQHVNRIRCAMAYRAFFQLADGGHHAAILGNS